MGGGVTGFATPLKIQKLKKSHKKEEMKRENRESVECLFKLCMCTLL